MASIPEGSQGSQVQGSREESGDVMVKGLGDESEERPPHLKHPGAPA